jgi:hypothetical protein
MHRETRVNLRSVMRDQAYAHAVFWASAQHARSDVAVAVLFERAARARLEDHYARLDRLVDPSIGIADLLADAIRLDLQQDYREFIVQANDAGDTQVAETLAAIQYTRDAELEALQAARIRHRPMAKPPTPTQETPPTEPTDQPTSPAQETPLPPDLPPVARIAAIPIEQLPPVAPEHAEDPVADEDAAAVAPEVDRDDSAAAQLAEPGVTTDDAIETPPLAAEPETIEPEHASAPEPLAAPRSTVEYKVIYIDKPTQKSKQGERELQSRLNMLAHQGWRLTEVIGSQLIMYRTLD